MLATAGDVVGVRRLVLVDPVWATSAWMAPLRQAILARLEGPQREAVASISEEALTAPDVAVHSAYSRAVYPAWFADAEMAKRFTPPEANSETGAAVLARLRRDGYDWRNRIRAVLTTTLVVHGERDPLALADLRDESYISADAQFIVVPSCGHMPFWEAPEYFFALIQAFL
jgi:pimeloyl-ACP methyl ester carboxylesterase